MLKSTFSARARLEYQVPRVEIYLSLFCKSILFVLTRFRIFVGELDLLQYILYFTSKCQLWYSSSTTVYTGILLTDNSGYRCTQINSKRDTATPSRPRNSASWLRRSKKDSIKQEHISNEQCLLLFVALALLLETPGGQHETKDGKKQEGGFSLTALSFRLRPDLILSNSNSGFLNSDLWLVDWYRYDIASEFLFNSQTLLGMVSLLLAPESSANLSVFGLWLWRLLSPLLRVLRSQKYTGK